MHPVGTRFNGVLHTRARTHRYTDAQAPGAARHHCGQRASPRPRKRSSASTSITPGCVAADPGGTRRHLRAAPNATQAGPFSLGMSRCSQVGVLWQCTFVCSSSHGRFLGTPRDRPVCVCLAEPLLFFVCHLPVSDGCFPFPSVAGLAPFFEAYRTTCSTTIPRETKRCLCLQFAVTVPTQ